MTSFRSITAPTTGLGCASATPLEASPSARNIRSRSRSRTPSVEEGIDIGLRVERHQIVDLFACSDESHRQIQLTRNRNHDSALRRAVQLGENDARNSGLAPELARLIQTVLPGCRVQ